ncbi:PAS domain-containing protein, partial [Streptomyces sp. TRM76130]|nr:PAS domain-containing protein [Streptomyces sp. TRM76130]
PDPADDSLLNLALAQSPCAMLLFDEQLRLCGVNEAMARLTLVPAEHLLGLRLTDMDSHPEYAKYEETLRWVLVTGKAHEVETFQPVAGETHPQAWLARVARLTDPDGRIRGICVSV